MVKSGPAHEMQEERRVSARRANSYPSKELQGEIRSLLLRVGITPTRTLMNRVKALTEDEAVRARTILQRVAIASENARRAHPEGKRTTDRQLADWERWRQTTGMEVTPEVLAHFLSLDTKTANAEIMSLRFLFWEERDAKGKTTRMRAERGLVTDAYVPAAVVPAPEPRRLTFEDL